MQKYQQLVIYSLALFILSFNNSLVNAACPDEHLPLEPPHLVTHQIKPFIAKYDLLKKKDSVGEAIRQLSYLSGNTLQFSYQTDANIFIFSDKRSEQSTTHFENNHLTPKHYIFQRSGTGSNKHYEWSFDIANNRAKDIAREKDLSVNFPKHIQDKLSFQLQLRLDLIQRPEQKEFIYPVISTSGLIKDYQFVFDGEEELLLPYGKIKSLRFKRDVKDKKKVTYVWFAAELDFLMVKLYQTKKGKSQFDAQLKSLEYPEET